MSKRPHILVVDDNEAMRDNLLECLEQEGYAADAVADGAAALARLERAPRPDVVLMDLLMPGMDGRALAAAIRAEPRWAGVRLALITGAELRPRGVAEVDEVLPKPFGVAELLAAIRRLSPPSAG
ncbi:MAG: response regulator [Anaeromyxobacter sp.]